MIPATREEQKKEAFRLFEDGRYQQSLQICTSLLEDGRDPAVEVLAATNLYYTGKLEDAEVFFRDLAQKMPDSSYVHSYLAKVLEARKDEGAIAEFATAVHLDPTNQDALRSYAAYLISHHDYRGALPVLRRLVQQGKKPGDVQNLMRVLIEIGEPEEALKTHSVLGEECVKTHEYVDALIKTGNFKVAAQSALRLYRDTKDPALLRKYLDWVSCSRSTQAATGHCIVLASTLSALADEALTRASASIRTGRCRRRCHAPRSASRSRRA